MKNIFTKITNYRTINIYAFIFTCAILIFAGYAQFHDHLVPCPLCVMQRILFAVLAILYLFGALYVANFRGRKFLHGTIFIVAVIGIGVAARHVYLQHLPPNLAPSCGPGLNFLFKHLPPTEALKLVLIGSGDCAVVRWHFLHLTMPEWSLICFSFLGLIALWQFFRRKI